MTTAAASLPADPGRPPGSAGADPSLALDDLDEQWRGRRADARRNHERVIAAALEVFTERGLDATIPDVAARAGVGKATVYRSFPARDDLLAAVALHQLDLVEQRVTAALREPDPAAALRDLVSYLFEQLRTDQLTATVLRTRAVPAADAARQRIMDIISAAIDAAKPAGTVRRDATFEDLATLVGGCAQQLHQSGITDSGAWQRYAALALAALRPDDA